MVLVFGSTGYQLEAIVVCLDALGLLSSSHEC